MKWQTMALTDRLSKYARLPELAYGLGLSPRVSRFDSEAGHTKCAPVTQLEEYRYEIDVILLVHSSVGRALRS